MKNKKPRSGPGRPSSMEDPYRVICDAAAALFAEKGFDNTSLQDVATAVGVTKAGLYHYFPTKQALFEAILKDTLRDLHAGAVAAIAAHDSYPDKLTAFMTAHARYFSEHGERYRASFFGRGGGGERASLTPDERAMRKAYVQLLEGVVEAGVDAGAITVSDVPTFARGVLGMLNWMARWYRPDGRLTAAEIAESYAQILLAGALPR
ncbi:TetR/AcrR family transcriptional regulator [Martelella sp. AMO21009]